MKQEKTLIGRVENIVLDDFSDQIIPAKVDTGADTSSIWASNIDCNADRLQFVLFDKNSPHYTGTVISLPNDKFSETIVENSFGHRENRYVVHLRIRLAGRLIKASFTLANREKKTYPVLLGRRLLSGKFVVDVSNGTPLAELEQLNRNERLATIKRKGNPA